MSLRDKIDETKLNLTENGGKFRAENCYNLLVDELKVDYAGAVWDNLIVLKHMFIYWQVVNKHLLTRDYLSRIINIQVELCPICDQEVESHDHLFCSCIFAKKGGNGCGWGCWGLCSSCRGCDLLIASSTPSSTLATIRCSKLESL
ncbi:hypothetical protein F8388_003662 [Cannabis sativa]|uniref:Reverse transcriptase zinc-binding domain-containing protein n=1 Tax=Cannabis sativa TaxID=3483 RepID=A0A7J6DU60_CANSA|nr:hypothetical protein F8388_003662 [Cannabis sativa]KAF4398714.1 hypothetical protein G4B88_017140 [Cannabis sativa]